jgi:hypothetical protein
MDKMTEIDQKLIQLKVSTMAILIGGIISITFSATTIYWNFSLMELEQQEIIKKHETDMEVLERRLDKQYQRLDERLKDLEKPNTDGNIK